LIFSSSILVKMILMTFAVLSLLLIFNSSAWGQVACPTKNLLTEPNSPFDKIPVYNQDGSGTCYAYTASQMANYYLLKKGETKTLEFHPLWAALQHAQSFNGRTIKSGITEIALDQLSGSPYCSHSSISASLQSIAQDEKISDHEIIGFIENLSIQYSELLKEYDLYVPINGRGPRTTSHPNKIYRINRPTPKPQTPAYDKSFKNKPLREFQPSFIDNTYVHRVEAPKIKIKFDELKERAITNAIKETRKYVTCSENSLRKVVENLEPILSVANTTMFKKILIGDCVQLPPRKLPVSHAFSPSNANDDDYRKVLRNHFAKSSQPLGISYCSTFLSKPELDGIKDDPSRPRSSNRVNGCGPHASLLVASRPSGKSCEYLLRNTWGAGYGAWTKNWSCSCKSKITGKFISECKKETHPINHYEVTGCWVPESKLVKNIFGTQWLN
jgi:hypothetical protein